MIKKQRNNKDCVITCLEFLLNLDYDYLKEKLGYAVDKEDLISFLNSKNIITTEIITEKGSKEFNVNKTNNLSIEENLLNSTSLVTVKLRNSYHCVVYKNNKIYDCLDSKIKNINELEIVYIIKVK